MTFVEWLKHKKPTISKEKKEAIDYLMYEFVKWWEEEKGNEENDLSVLKFTSLFFLVLTVDDDISLIEDLNINFNAEPYGAIDREVRMYAKYCGRINNHKTTLEDSITIHTDKRLRTFISKLKNINKDLITYSSWDLMKIVHDRYSWAQAFHIAKKKNTFSEPIDKKQFKNDFKTYYKQGII